MRALLAALVVLALNAQAQPPPKYQVVQPDTYSYGTRHGRTVYESMGRGQFDREPMTEIYPGNRDDKQPPVSVVPFSEPDDNAQRVLAPQPGDGRLPATGEDRIFYQIEQDQQKSRCYMTDEDCVEIEYFD